MEYTCTPIEGIIASVTVETRAGFFSPVITWDPGLLKLMEYTCTPIEGIIASVTVETRAGFFSPVITVTAAKTPGFRIDNVDGLYLHTDCGNNFPVNPRSERPDRFTASVC